MTDTTAQTPAQTPTATLDGASVPRFARGTRLRHDEARGMWILLAPERVLQPDGVAVEILKRVDGARSLDSIVDDLATAFAVDRARIDTDVRAFLGDLAGKGFLEVVS